MDAHQKAKSENWRSMNHAPLSVHIAIDISKGRASAEVYPRQAKQIDVQNFLVQTNVSLQCVARLWWTVLLLVVFSEELAK